MDIDAIDIDAIIEDELHLLKRDVRPHLLVSFNGNVIKSLIDTGSTKSFIDYDVIKDNHNINISATTQQFKGISNTKLDVIGHVSIEIVLHGMSPSLNKKKNLYVVKVMKHPMLFGIDIISSAIFKLML